jgi:hypothetical protein
MLGRAIGIRLGRGTGSLRRFGWMGLMARRIRFMCICSVRALS